MILSWISASFIQVFLLFLFKAESPRDRLQPAVVMVCFSAAAVENQAIMCWHMPENHCAINACSLCIWQVCCWVCPPVVRLGFDILHPHIISLQVPALYGMAAALRRVIGYWADCFACGLFFRPFVVSFFFRAPLPFTLSSYSLARGCTAHTQDQHSHCFALAFFRLIFFPLFLNY